MKFTQRIKCPLCGEPIEKSRCLMNVASEWVKREEKLQYVYCRRCGLVYEKYLSDSKKPMTTEHYSIEDYKYRVKQKEKFHRDRIKWLFENLTPHKKDTKLKIIDIGTADASFLKYVKDLGFEVMGVEPDRKFCEYCRQLFGIEVIPSTLEDAVLPAGHFDIATVFGVFEHIYDPNRFLSVIHKILKPGAFLYMAIPTVFYIHSGSIARSHTCLYSKNTLTQILEANGFKILNTNEPGLGGIFYNRTEIFASKDSPAAGYKFHAGDSYLRIKSKLNWRIFSGHFEWLFMFFPSILKKKHPRIYSFARAVYRFFKPKKESLDD